MVSMERMHKSAFCRRELTALLKVVHILYATTGGVTTVCVTADSLLALARDVLKKLD